MSATNFTPISLYYSATATSVPVNTNLVAGELAINTNDGKLFYKDSAGVVQVLATKATTGGTFTSLTDSGLTSGRVTYATTGGLLTDSANLTFNGTALTVGGSLTTTDNLSGLTTLGSFSTGSYNWALIRPTSGATGIEFRSYAGTAQLNIEQSTGNVGIGTSSPNYQMQLYKSGAVANYLQVTSGATGAASGNGALFGVDASGNGIVTVQGAVNYITSVAGSEKMRIDSSGNVGIGTSSPASKLDVTGSITVQSTAVVQFGSGFTDYISGNATSHFMQFQTNSNERMRIDSSGNVGIGTSSPSSYGQFAVVGNSTGNLYQGNFANINVGSNTTKTVSTAFYLADTGATIKRVASILAYPDGVNVLTGGMTFNVRKSDTDVSEAMRIDSSGNLGIGTSSPAYKLDGAAGNYGFDIFGSNTGVNYLTLRSGFAPTASGGIGFKCVDLGNGSYDGLATYANQGLSFYSAQTERMRIDSSGNLLVGTTSNPNSWKVNVNGTIGANALSMVGSNSNISITNQTTGDSRPAYFANNNAGGLPNGSVFIFNQNDPNSSAYSGIQFVAGSTTRFIVYGNGAVNATGAYTNISDARIKKDVVDATPKLDKLMKVRVVNYTRTDHENNIKEIGVISQELEQIFPNLIMEVEEKDKDGNVTCPDRKLVKYSVFVPILIKAMQEQQALIESLTTRLTGLESK